MAQRILSACPALALTIGLFANCAVAELSDRHEIEIALYSTLADTDSNIGSWPDAGFGKLRYDTDGSLEHASSRLALAYRGQLSTTVFAHAVADYISDASQQFGLSEAYLEWRPLPTSRNRHRYRFGAYYPAISLENTDFAWESPYSDSFSALNAWIGEEVRSLGADWRLTRDLGQPGSPITLDLGAGFFYGNDPAGTLLFWRGWSVHDRQTRLNERLPLPPLVTAGASGEPDTVISRQLDPMAEIDDDPGIHVSVQWSYANRLRLSAAYWDNRSDPWAFRDGQWAWDTKFRQLSAQVSLPGDVGLIAQRMRGNTGWLVNVTATGQTTAATALAVDEFESQYILLSRHFRSRHRLSLRHDDFRIWRTGAFESDNGDALTVSYRIALDDRMTLTAEWTEIDSRRDLWPLLYNRNFTERSESQFSIGLRYVLFDSSS